jgi:hypothetical protein
MKRARLIIKEIQITKQGEIKNFQIKLPKNVKRVLAIETDVRIESRIDGATDHPADGTTTPGSDGTVAIPVRPIEKPLS